MRVVEEQSDLTHEQTLTQLHARFDRDILFTCRRHIPLTSWLTNNSGQYARVTETTTTAPVTTWPSPGIQQNNANNEQVLPAYADVHMVLYSTNFVYVRSSDLASHRMGPWYKEYAKINVNGLWPENRSLTSKIPRFPTPAASPNQVSQGPVGVLVNGVTIANLGDGSGYKTATGQDGGITGGGVPGNQTDVWIRCATGAEGPILDGGFGPEAAGAFERAVAAAVAVHDRVAGEMGRTSDGARLVSSDRSCVVPNGLFATDAANTLNHFKNFVYAAAPADGGGTTLDRSREGHFEMLEMAVFTAAAATAAAGDAATRRRIGRHRDQRVRAETRGIDHIGGTNIGTSCETARRTHATKR